MFIHCFARLCTRLFSHRNMARAMATTPKALRRDRLQRRWIQMCAPIVESQAIGRVTAERRRLTCKCDRLKRPIQETFEPAVVEPFVEDLTIFSQPSSSSCPFKLCMIRKVCNVCSACIKYDMTCTDDDHCWTICPSSISVAVQKTVLKQLNMFEQSLMSFLMKLACRAM